MPSLDEIGWSTCPCFQTYRYSSKKTVEITFWMDHETSVNKYFDLWATLQPETVKQTTARDLCFEPSLKFECISENVKSQLDSSDPIPPFPLMTSVISSISTEQQAVPHFPKKKLSSENEKQHTPTKTLAAPAASLSSELLSSSQRETIRQEVTSAMKTSDAVAALTVNVRADASGSASVIVNGSPSVSSQPASASSTKAPRVMRGADALAMWQEMKQKTSTKTPAAGVASFAFKTKVQERLPETAHSKDAIAEPRGMSSLRILTRSKSPKLKKSVGYKSRRVHRKAARHVSGMQFRKRKEDY